MPDELADARRGALVATRRALAADLEAARCLLNSALAQAARAGVATAPAPPEARMTAPPSLLDHWRHGVGAPARAPAPSPPRAKAPRAATPFARARTPAGSAAWKLARVGERLSPWVSLGCVAMAAYALLK